jgi:uncharacterized membrane protein YkvA (DUF1232 family)
VSAARKRPASKSGRTTRQVPQDVEIEVERAPRTGAKRTVMGSIAELPNFLKLLYGLITDNRVNALDKLVVAGAIAYILLPVDVIPDFIPFLGEVDDVFLLILALQRLITNAGRSVVQTYWAGDPKDLSEMNLEKILAACAFFLPRRMRRRLRTIGRV